MQDAHKPLGFWSCWSLTVGCMIGSGIFLLPTVLAPYGLLSFGGWIIAGGGSIALALAFARLAGRTTRSGGPYAYVQEAFGDFIGFLMGWTYWISNCIGLPVIAIGFVGYLTVFIPALSQNTFAQAATALALIWIFTLVNVRGLKHASAVQIAMTLLKIVPLVGIVALALAAGTPANMPAFNPSHASIFSALAATALLTLWPFTGFEMGTLPAGDVKDAQNTVPRALITGMLTVTVIYLSATTAVMLLVPPEQLARSTAPFSDAARLVGAWGPAVIAGGALIATAGTLNGLIFVAGQTASAVAVDKLAPQALAATNKGGAPHVALILSAAVASVLLLTNYSRGLIGAFTFLLMMATVTTLLPYLFCALAEMRKSWRSAKGWALVALIGCAYTIFASIGSGMEVFAWGVVLTVAGAPLYFVFRPRSAARQAA